MLLATLSLMDTQTTEALRAGRRNCWQHLHLEDLSHPDDPGPTSFCHPESVCESHGVGQEDAQDDYLEMLDLGVRETALEIHTGTGAAIYPLQD